MTFVKVKKPQAYQPLLLRRIHKAHAHHLCTEGSIQNAPPHSKVTVVPECCHRHRRVLLRPSGIPSLGREKRRDSKKKRQGEACGLQC